VSDLERHLESQLAELGEHLDVPSGDHLAARVSARVRSRRQRTSSRRRLTVAFATVLALVLGLSLAPALGDWLGVRGAEVTQGPAPTSSAPPPTSVPTPPTNLDLGTPSTLVDAARRVGFPMLVPPVLGPPAEVWLDTRPAVPIVTMTFPGRLVSEFRAAIADDPVVRKFAPDGVRVEELTIDGRRALWIDGMHEVMVERDGELVVDRLRLSDSALLVEMGEVTVRIETRFGRGDAVEIARNLRVLRGVDAP
jgi:hypothetical protein